METLIIYTAFLLGFSGSLHCFGMCGPIAFSIIIDRKHYLKMFFQNIIYQFGRIVSYTILGILFGIIGYGFSLAGFHKILSFSLGLGMIISILISKKKLKKFKFLINYTPLLSKIKVILSDFIKKKTFYTLFITGILNGLLPCGLVYIAVTTAMSTGKVVLSGLFMLYFGIGTIPLMFTTMILGNFINFHIKNKILKTTQIIIFFIGFLLILRSLELNIKYISPIGENLYPKKGEKEKMYKIKLIPNYKCH